MKKILLLLVILLTIFSDISFAQLMKEKHNYTRGDTLRGTLSPERTWFDVTYYDLNLNIDIDNKQINGYNDIHFKVNKPHGKMQIDLFKNMNIDSILLNNKALTYTREFNAVFIPIEEKMAAQSQQKIRIYYSGAPIVAENPPWDGGFVWRKDKNDKDWIGVACQGIGASLWWPNKDHQSDEPDSMRITGTVPADLKFVANGQMEKKTLNEDKSRATYQWLVSYPINNYAVSINIADYVHFGDVYVSGKDSLQLNYYVLPYNKEVAEKHFEQVKPMMKCFEEYLGRFPFWRDGFALIETPYLGMEHQSGIAYGNQYKTGYAGRDYSRIGLEFDYIIIHEAGHEWWGNNVTSEDIADMWIHEGFCTYSEALYVECMHGKKTALDYVNAKKPGIGNERAIIGHYGVNKEGSGDMYNKGMLFLNTVRHIVDNDELWRDILKGLNKDFQYGIVTTDVVVEYINRKTGKKMNKIFDQYLKHPKIPVLEYKLKKRGKKCTDITYRWKADVEGFDMPIQYKDAKGKWQWLKPTTQWQTTKKIKKVKPENFQFAERLFYFELDNQSDSK